MEDRSTDQPPGPEPWGDVPPWEQPGAFRLDVIPHRGDGLYRLAAVALTAAVLGMFLVCSPLCAPVATLLGLPAWVFASRDLGLMRRGLMDPRGKDKTGEAQRYGRAAVWLGLIDAAVTLPLLWRMTR
jgi:hypothetical protein